MIFSYTLIDTFHNVCPRQAYERWWNKLPSPDSPESLAGKRVHKELERRLSFREPMLFEMRELEPICAAIEARGVVQTEKKLAVARDLTSTGFFDGDVYLRGVLDVLLVPGRSAFVVDWKTGKNREASKEPLQLMLSAAYVFAEYPDVGAVTALNVYTKTAQMGQAHSWSRAELPTIWRTLLPLVHEIEQAEMDGPSAFKERPGALCGYCPVKNCQHNRSAA